MLELRPKILYVNDDPDACEVMTLFLRMRSMEAEAASNSSEALARASEAEFDLFILDLIMPAPNGLELFRKLRQLYPHHPIVMYTGMADGEARNKARAAGASDFVMKPEFHELLPVLERHGMYGSK